MRRSNLSLSVLTMLAGGLFVVAANTAGCGGKTDEPSTEPTDTGVSIVTDAGPDTSAPVDTGTPMVDSGTTWDVPGSLYDADIPDIIFDGGTSAASCVGCAGRECKKEVDACDSDPQCRGLLLCALTKCGGSTTDLSCLMGCLGEYGVGFSDPVVGTVYAVGTCVQKKCTSDCPVPADAGAPKPDAKSDAPGDATGDATGDAETGAYMIFPSSSPAPRSIDPRLIDVQEALSSMSPDVKSGLIGQLTH